jgi:hypothetical protein
MTAVPQSVAAERPRPDSTSSIWEVRPTEIAALALLLLTAAAVRLPFWPRLIQTDDALNYYFGALSTHVAHPPGYIGYCVLGGLLNHLIGSIQVTFLLISFCASAMATALIHFLAKSFGLRWPAAFLTAVAYCFSINTQYASLSASPHIVEGMFAILIALLARQAMRTRRAGLAVAMTLVFALAGAFRPTTTLLLGPLWLYVMLRFASGAPRMRALGLILMQCVIAVAIVGGWSWANEHYTARAGYGHKSFEVQALMPSVYEYAGLSPKVEIGPLRLTFHMPAVEIVAWIEVKTGWRLLPHLPGWPTPSLRRAGQLMLMQTLKEGWWFMMAAPCAVLLPLVWITRSRSIAFPSRPDRNFLLLWILPAVLFFILGHMGAATYLQIYLPAVYLVTVYCLLGKWFGPAAGLSSEASDGSRVMTPIEKARFMGAKVNMPVPLALLCVCIGGSFTVFNFGHPFADNRGVRRLANLMLLQHTGRCLHEGSGMSRFQGDLEPSRKSDGDDYAHARTDADLLRIARRDHFSPIPVFPNEQAPPPP